jgi:hypothetical protein
MAAEWTAADAALVDEVKDSVGHTRYRRAAVATGVPSRHGAH